MSGTDFVNDKFFRPCDICGTPRKASEITVRDNVAICFRHKGYRTAKELDKLNATKRIPVAQIRKGTRPLAPLPTWEVEEARIFDLVVSVAPFETYDTTSDGGAGITGTKSVPAAAWAGIYLYALIAEAKRPAAWIVRAKTKLAEVADYLISVQSGSSGITIGTFGGSPWLSGDIGASCLTLLRAYQITGLTKYLDAAKAGVGAIVNFQATNLIFTTPDAILYGPPTHSVTLSGSFMDHRFYPGDLTCLWAEKVLFGIAGDGTYGTTDTALGFWSSPPARLLSVSMAQIQSFWTSGVANPGATAVINGLSAATPFDFFDTTAGWSTTAGNLFSSNWTGGVRALYEVAGASAQLSGCVSYLQSIGQNPATLVPAGYSAKRIQTTLLGTFDPTIAPCAHINVATRAESTGLYDLAAAGLIAPLVPRASLEAFKEAIGELRPRTLEGSPRDGRYQALGRLGRCGYSFQPYSPSLDLRRESVTMASKVGLAYRVDMAGMGSH